YYRFPVLGHVLGHVLVPVLDLVLVPVPTKVYVRILMDLAGWIDPK
ncbi:hypothetical protein PENSOL_c202G10981, partial [Penicillium solitum]